MPKGGLIIRLVDVAMIILFGFIAISDIKVRAQIKLPSDQQETLDEDKPGPEFIFIKIDEQNGFSLEADREIQVTTMSRDALEQSLLALIARYKAAGQEAVVLIEPDEESLIQHTVDALDICERNGIARNINYESMQF